MTESEMRHPSPKTTAEHIYESWISAVDAEGYDEYGQTLAMAAHLYKRYSHVCIPVKWPGIYVPPPPGRWF